MVTSISVVGLEASAATVISQVSRPATLLAVPPYMAWLTFVVIVLIFIFVVWPSIWSRRAVRRTAAMHVLELLARLA